MWETWVQIPCGEHFAFAWWLILSSKIYFSWFKWYLPFNIAIFLVNSLVFQENLMILSKNCNLRCSVPLRFCPQKNHKSGILSNKQTDISAVPTSKRFLPLGVFMDGDMRKKYYVKHWKNVISCFFLKYILFVVVTWYKGLEGSNLEKNLPRRGHMARKCPNYWFSTKKNHVKKSVPKIYNSPCALALKGLQN